MNRSDRSYFLLWLLLAVIVALSAITGQSLWIDEGASAIHAMQGSITDLWWSLRNEANSNMQIIWYHLYIWIFEKVSGHSEFALRAANIPLFAMGVGALYWGLAEAPRLRPWVLASFLASPFVWYYLGEVRPYALFSSAACLMIAPIVRVITNRDTKSIFQRSFWWLLSCGIILMTGTSLISAPWVAFWGISLLTVVGVTTPKIWLKTSPISLLLTITLGIFISAYYLWTLTQEFRTSVGTNTFQTIIFCFYEHLGFSGMGPGRLALRESPASLLAFPEALLLATYSAVLFVALICISKKLKGDIQQIGLAPILLILAPVPIVFILGMERDTRILGRHIAPLAPIISISFGLIFYHLWSNKGPFRLLAIAILAFLVLSDFRIRFDSRYGRDDYRSASHFAKESLSSDLNVLWAADSACAVYYGVIPHADIASGNSHVQLGFQGSLDDVDTVVLSKPDIYDNTGAIQAELSRSNFSKVATLNSFTIWTRSKAIP